MNYKNIVLYTKSMFLIISIVVPLLVYVIAPRLVAKNRSNAGYRWLLVVACLLFFVSWYIPSPRIDGRDTAFMTHLIGGGIFTGFLWLYFKYSLGWRAVWWLEGFSLFALVSALGCVNELFELFVTQAGLVPTILDDTNWDILANSLGTLAVYAGYMLYDSRH